MSRYEAYEPSSKNVETELFFWPWMGILANIPVQQVNGRYIGESGAKLRDKLIFDGFNPIKVVPLWDFKGHSTYALVEFNKDWSGFESAMKFDKTFERNYHGKKDYFSRREKGVHFYGWVAQSDDFYSNSIIGKNLRKSGDLRSIAEVEEEEKRKTGKLVSNLANEIEIKNKRLKEIEHKYMEVTSTKHRVMVEKDEMHRAYNEEIKKMQQNARGQLENIFTEHERIKVHLERVRCELEQKEKMLEKREFLNENERKKIYSEKQMNVRAAFEQKKSDENILNLAEDQKKQKEALHVKIMELEKKIDAKQALELEIERLRGAVQVRNLMGWNEDEVEIKKLIEIKANLKDKEEEMESLDALNNTLMVKERNANDELQEARKELMKMLRIHKKGNYKPKVAVKRMGELDEKLFRVAVKKKWGKDEDDECELLLSKWENHIRDSNWYPFKVVQVGESHQRIIDENDEKLKSLKSEIGIEAYEAVTNALMELNEYNSSGRYPQPNLWNFEENRRATLKEGISYISTQLKNLEKRKT